MAEKPDVNDPAIEEWRQRIDLIDEQLMRLLNSRSACAVEIGKIKRRLGLPLYSPGREAWILARVMRENPGPLEPLAVRRVFERVIDESRRLERMAGQQNLQDQPGSTEGREAGVSAHAVGQLRPSAPETE